MLKQKYWLKLMLAITPLLLAGVITSLYSLTFSVFIQCKWELAGCRKFTVSSAYLDNGSPLNRYPTDKSKAISEVERGLDSRIKEKAEVDKELENAFWVNEDLAKKVEDAARALTNSNLSDDDKKKLNNNNKDLIALKGASDSVVEALALKQTRMDEHIKTLQAQLLSSHKRNASIYWNRLMYATFIALFFIAALACLALTVFVIHKVFSPHGKWILRGGLGAVALISVAVGLFLYFTSAEYFVVINEVTGRIKTEDMANIDTLMNGLNSFGYAVTTSVVLAVTVLLWFPKELFNNDPNEFIQNVDLLSIRMKYLRLILYAGTVMLLIALFRLRAILDWSLAFLLQDDVSAAESVNKALISSQGTFFTLLLAIVYIPAAYIILKLANSLTAPPDAVNKSEILSEKGLTITFTSYKEYLPRLAVILIPFLVGPVAEIVKGIFV